MKKPMAMHSLLIVLLFLYSNASAGLITTCEGVTDTSLTGFSTNVISLSNQEYRAYYMGGTGGIVSALSSDGIVWTQESGTRLQGATNPWVFRTSDNRFRMIYDRQDSSGNRTLYSAISIDGLNFTQEKQIMAGTSADINPQSNTTFLSVPTGLSLGDGSLRMYFLSDGTAIRSAISEDEGLTWSRDDGTRITNGVDPAIITLSDDSYLMFYTDWSPQYRTKRILYATSYDGLNFTTASSPFISEDDLTQSMMDPEVIPASNGRYRLYFTYGGTTEKIYSCLLPQSFTAALTIGDFSDTPPGYWAYSYIGAIYRAGITVGCRNGQYCPSEYVTRNQMAAFIIRALYGETFNYTQTPYFTDVPLTDYFFKYVQKLKDLGITAVSEAYLPNNNVTREQMAAFLVRAMQSKTGQDTENFTYTTTRYFSDVPTTDIFFKYVQKLKDNRITSVTGTYSPDQIVPRDQMAAFIARAFLMMP